MFNSCYAPWQLDIILDSSWVKEKRFCDNVQPTIADLQKERGVNSIYHNNSIATWLVKSTGEVENVRLG